MTREIIRAYNFSIREIKGRYYVYLIDRSKPKLRYTYVAPLDKVIEFYLESRGLGAVPPVRGVGFEPTQAYASGASVRPL